MIPILNEIIQLVTNFIINLISSLGYFGIFVAMTIESALIPLPSEIIMPFSGYLVAQGRFNIWLVTLMGALGNVLGSWIAYYIGIKGGRPLVLKYGKYIFISKHEIEKADKWFKKYGSKAIFFSRLLPAIRTFISLPAGIAKMNFKKFTLYTFIGSLPWSFGLTFIGYKIGQNWNKLSPIFHRIDIVILVLIIVSIIILYRRYKKY